MAKAHQNPAAHVSSGAPRRRGETADPQQTAATRAPFLLVHQPARWGVIGDRVLPQLHEYVLEHGVNGCLVTQKTLPDGRKVKEYDLDGCEANLKSKGAQPLAWDFAGEGTTYIVEAAPDVWLAPWESLLATGEIDRDQVEYREWLEGLVDSGAIKPVRARVVEVICKQLRDVIADAVKRSDRAQAAEHEKLLAVAEEELETARGRERDERDARKGRSPSKAGPVVKPKDEDEKPRKAAKPEGKASESKASESKADGEGAGGSSS